MENPDIISPIIEVIKPYDALDLLAKVGALQLCPENTDHAIRFEALAHAINCLKFESNKPVCTIHRLDRICSKPPLGNGPFQSQEDPTPNAFTEAFSFFGGSYIVFPGQLSDPTFILNHLNAAIFFGDRFKTNNKFKDKIYGLNRVLLELSDTIAKRVGLVRNMAPNPHSSKIYIPPDIEAKKSSVVFLYQELDDYLDSMDLDFSSLEPFIQPFGQLRARDYSFQNSPLHSRPIIRFEDNLIIAEPWMLLASLQHHILLTAKDYGVLGFLLDEYQKTILYTVGSSLDRFGHKQIPRGLPETDLKLEIRESIWTLDTDKILYTAVITDNFTDYIGDELFEDHINIEEGELLDVHLTAVENYLRQKTTNLGEIFFLIINAGIGRSRFIGLQLNKLTQAPIVLMLSAAELEIFSFLYDNDILVLYKFAKAQLAIRETTAIISWSTLDEFEIYRKNDFSYYLDDGQRPELITVGAGGERELRIEVLQKHDIHAVPYYESNGWIEVENVYQTRSCPIYTPLIFRGDRVSFFVELSPVSFWISANIDVDQFERNPDAPNPGIFVDLISYWIWQFNEELSICLTGVDFDAPLNIEIKIAMDGKWKQDLEQPQYENSPLSVAIAAECKIIVTVKPAILQLLNTSNNFGEIQIMQMLLEGLCELLTADGWSEPSNKLTNMIPTMIEKQKSFPLKKKLLAINLNRNPSLLPGNSVSFRKVQEADRSILLDEIENLLQNELHIPKGIISKEQHTRILNSIVEFYFRKLSQIVSNLSSEHLLDFLVTYYEAIISDRFNRQITIATQLACFSSIQELTQQLTEQLPAIDDAAIACRFLIEFVVTQPPIGNNPISLSAYDQMMAIASEIIGRGSQSDLAKYRLFDFKFELLGSGRLGFNRSEYNARSNAYQNFRSNSEIVEAIESFPRWWNEIVTTDQNDFPPHIRQLNQAFEAEFGLVLTDISHFISELGDLSMSLDSGQLKEMELSILVDKLSNILGWKPEKVLSIIDFLSLTPRKDFLEPPSPFKKADIYPWRMSRGLSYMRRPLLIVIKNDQKIVCWGVRHLFTSFDYLLQATVSGRLQDDFRSNEMRSFLGKVHTDEGEEFNNRVHSAITRIPGIIADKKVKKFGKTRIGAPGNDLGDLDILAIFPKTRKIGIIECKDLEIARNPIEMSRELETLFIGNAHAESTMTKHMRRVEWVKSNLALVLGSYGINDFKNWRIEPILVVSSEMITPHFHKVLMPVYSYNRFVSEYLPRHT